MICNLCKKPVRSFLCDNCKAQFPFHNLDDDLFKIALYELKNGPISYDPDKMDSLFYNPIFDRDTYLRDRIADLDPDVNHSNYTGNCEFSTVDELNERLSTNLNFSIFHLNVRSLVKNHEDLSHLLANIDHKFSVLAITETWIKDDDPYDHFPIYSAIATDHHSEKGRHHIIVRDINEMRIQDFKSKLANIDWTSTKNAPDTNAMYDSFIEKYTGLFDSCFPFRTIKGKALNSFRKPWITKGLLKSIKKKNKLYKIIFVIDLIHNS